MKKGDLVKAKQGTVEGDPESLGIGLIIEANQDLELVSEGQRRTGER